MELLNSVVFRIFEVAFIRYKNFYYQIRPPTPTYFFLKTPFGDVDWSAEQDNLKLFFQ